MSETTTPSGPGPARPGRGLHRYAAWLAGISWKRFSVLCLLVLAATALLSELPPFSTRWGDDTNLAPPPHRPGVVIERRGEHGYEVRVDARGVRIAPRTAPASSAPGAPPPLPSADVALPPGASTEEIREAVATAQTEIEDALAALRPPPAPDRAFRLADYMMEALLVLILLSVIVKVMGQGRRTAEVRAAAATERADSESLRRQVVEARMAAMQAQVEPHFLFNTLASIDHLIETDPARASTMQKHLIALLRASMPTLREGGGVHDLGHELAVIRPYLEILKVRMEERLATEIDVPEGLHSARFPPLVLQGLVENAIKHGLEPKPGGGRLTVRAQIVHGKLAVSVADTGLGFGQAATAGTGVGLANIRERLALLYGGKAALAVTENPGGGTVVTVTVPYAVRGGDDLGSTT